MIGKLIATIILIFTFPLQNFAVRQVTPSAFTSFPPTTPSKSSIADSTDKPHTYEPSNESENLTSVFLEAHDINKSPLSQHCPTNASCSELPAECLNCTYNLSCIYAQKTISQCRPAKNVVCAGSAVFNISHDCLYCYQTSIYSEHTCTLQTTCRTNGYPPYPPHRYISNCSVHPEIFCLGKRSFKRMMKCRWTSGKRWRTALVYSITLGGLGADRFYLGHWKEGLGKLFSFGGLGIWTLVDVLLVATGYLTPADGSVYI